MTDLELGWLAGIIDGEGTMPMREAKREFEKKFYTL